MLASTSSTRYSALEYYPAGDANKIIVRDEATLWAVVRWLVTRRVIIFDFETSGLAWYRDARAVGCAFASWDDEDRLWCYYVPYRHRTGESQINPDVAVRAVCEVLACGALLVAHQLKFDEHFARVDGARLGGGRYCTLIASALWDENKSKELEARVKWLCGVEDPWYWDRYVQHELEQEAKRRGVSKSALVEATGYAHVPVNLLGTYACHDVQHTAMLYSFYESRGHSSRFPRIWATEMGLIEVLVETEEAGLPVDVGYLTRLRSEVATEVERLDGLIRAELGSGFNPASDDEVAHLLYEVYRQPVIKRTKSKKPSVDDDVLAYFEDRVAVCRLLRQRREADKIKSTYTDSIFRSMDDRHVSHPDFQQVGAATGRLSCRSPNFQNIVSDSDERALKATGKRVEDGGVDPWSIRRAFIIDESGRRRIFADYSQIELRGLAANSGEPILTEVFLTGQDAHARTQQEVSEMVGRYISRRLAKVINFGLSYGMTEVGLSRQAKITLEDAQIFLDGFFRRYAGITSYRERFYAEIRQRPGGWFRNRWGRMRRLPKITSHKEWEAGRAERMAIASKIQGEAAELTKESMVRVHRWLKEEGLPAEIRNTVHDEIQVDSDVDAAQYVAAGVKRLMEDYDEFAPIPIVVDVEYSDRSWADKQTMVLEAA